MPGGTPLSVVPPGVVVEASTGYNGGYGNFVTIKLDDGRYIKINHLSAILVKQGDKVGTGSGKDGGVRVVGKVGSTGLSTGPHMHLDLGTGYNRGSAQITGLMDPDSFILNGGVVKGGNVKSTGEVTQTKPPTSQPQQNLMGTPSSSSGSGISGQLISRDAKTSYYDPALGGINASGAKTKDGLPATSTGEGYRSNVFSAAAFPPLIKKLPSSMTVPSQGFPGGRTLKKPFNVIVTNSKGKKAVIRVNDVGPGVKGHAGNHMLDLSVAAKNYLGTGGGFTIEMANSGASPGPIKSGQTPQSTPSPAQITPSPAQIASTRTPQNPQITQSLTPERKGQTVIVSQNPSSPPQQMMYSGGGGSSGGGSLQISEFALLNNFMRNKLLLDLAYL